VRWWKRVKANVGEKDVSRASANPAESVGAKLCQSVPQLEACTYLLPRASTKSTTETLITTMVELKRALSLIPMARIAVMTSAIMKAGKFEANFHAENFWRVYQVVSALHQLREWAAVKSITRSRKALRSRHQCRIGSLRHLARHIFSAVSRAVQWS